jgi:hypothetical protein
MVANQNNMNLLNFNKRFPTEEACRLYLKERREAEGIVCKKCGGTKHYWFANMQIWKCAECYSRKSLRAGTLMEKSHLPVKTWFMCIHLMTSVKKSFSALEMQRQLGLKRYEPVWYMMQKIRRSMGKRDKKYKLRGQIELDDAFFEIVDLEHDEEDQKRGRGSKKQKKVLVMVESTANQNQTNPHKKNRIMGFVKMISVSDLSANRVNYEIKNYINPNSVIISDSYHSYDKVYKVVDTHLPMIVPAKEADKKLPWVHTVIANAKRLFLGIHHSIGKTYLQNYLNEFCYKLNRRNFKSDLFDRMIIAGANSTWY